MTPRYRVIEARRTAAAHRFPGVFAERPFALQRLEPSPYGRGTWVVLDLYATREEAQAAKERLRHLAPAE